MSIYNVELRKRTGTTYGDKVLVATDKTLVEGLLGGDGKILEALMPTSVFGGLRFVSTITKGATYDTNAWLGDLINGSSALNMTTNLHDAVGQAPTSANAHLFKGFYFVIGEELTLNSQADGDFNATWDDGVAVDLSALLEPGDWVICTGWNTTDSCLSFAIVNNTYSIATTAKAGIMSAADKLKLNGLSNYSHPTDGADTSIDIPGDEHIGTIQVDSYGHVTSVSTSAIRTVTPSLSGLMSAADKTKLDTVAQNANNYSLPTASASVLGGVKVGSRLTISAGVLSADSQTDNNFTTALKNKLDGIEAGANAYTPPADGANTTLTLGGIEKIAGITVAADGRVTSVSKENIANASATVKGVVELATNAETQAGTDSTLAVTPAGLQSALGFALGFPIFADLSAANAAAVAGTYKDGSLAFVEV